MQSVIYLVSRDRLPLRAVTANTSKATWSSLRYLQMCHTARTAELTPDFGSVYPALAPPLALAQHHSRTYNIPIYITSLYIIS